MSILYRCLYWNGLFSRKLRKQWQTISMAERFHLTKNFHHVSFNRRKWTEWKFCSIDGQEGGRPWSCKIGCRIWRGSGGRRTRNQTKHRGSSPWTYNGVSWWNRKEKVNHALAGINTTRLSMEGCQNVLCLTLIHCPRTNYHASAAHAVKTPSKIKTTTAVNEERVTAMY